MADALLSDADVGLAPATSANLSGVAAPSPAAAASPSSAASADAPVAASGAAPAQPAPADDARPLTIRRAPPPTDQSSLSAPMSARATPTLMSDADVGLPPADAATASAQGAGPLGNTQDDGWLSGAAKGAATGVIKGLSHIPGWVGDVDDLSTFLAAGAASMFDSRSASDIYKDMKAKNAALPAALRSPGAVLPSSGDVAAPVLAQTGEYKPTSEVGSLAQAAVEAAAGGIGPGAGGLTKGAKLGSTLLSTVKQAPLNALAGAAGQGATDATGNPYLGLAASLALPAGVEGAGKVGAKVISPAIEDVPVIGRAFPNQREVNVGNKIIGDSSDPEAIKAFARTGQTPDGDAQTLPGPSPTTGAVLGDAGLLNKQRELMRDPNSGLREHAEAHNAAQVDGLRSIASDDADDTLPSRFLQQQGAAIDQAAEAAHNRILAHAQELAARLGPGQTADESGAAVRTALDRVDATSAASDAANVAQARDAAGALGTGTAPELNGQAIRTAQEAAKEQAQQMRRDLYAPETLDPEGKINLVMTGASDGAKTVRDGIDPFGPEVGADPQRIMQKMQSLPAVMPYKSVMALDTDITGAMAKERRANGESYDWQLLKELKGHVMGSVHDALDNQHAYEQSAVQTGRMAAGDTMMSRLQAEANAFKAARAQATGPAGGRDPAANPAGGSPRVSRFGGAEGQNAGRPGDAAGNQGLSQPAPLTPSVDDGFADRLRTAKDFHAAYDQTFRKGVVGQDLKTTGFAGQYQTGPGALAGKILPAGPGGYDVMRARLMANGNDSAGLAAIQDQALGPLRAKLDDGMLPQSAIDAWKTKHGGALRALDEAVPGFSSRYDRAGAAHTAVMEARAAADGANVTRRYAGTPAQTITKAIKSGPEGYERLKTLFGATGNDPHVIGAVKDQIVAPLRRGLLDDATVAPKAHAAWERDYAPALRALDEVSPGFSRQFGDAAKATDILMRAGAIRQRHMEEFQASAASSLLGKTDPVEAQNEILGMIRDGKNGPTRLRQLMTQMKGSSEAQEGVRKLARDGLLRELQNTSEAGTSDQAKVSNDKVTKLIRNNRAALQEVFTPGAVNRLEMVARSLQLNNRDVTAGTIKASAADRARDISHALGDKLSHSSAAHAGIGAVLGEQLLEHMHNPAMLAAAGTGAAALYAINKMRGRGQAVQDVMYHDAIKDPLVAQRYVTRALDAKGTDANARAAANMLRRQMLAAPIVKQAYDRSSYAHGGAVATGRERYASSGTVLGGIPPSVQAALNAGNGFARGGAVGLPQPLFTAAPLPSVATPGLASPRGLVGAHHRQHFADGGLPHHVLAALGLRPHFEDGGDAGSGSDHSSSSSSSGGDNGGDGHGNGGDNSSSSGSAGGVGGFGGSSNGDGYGGGSSSSSTSSGSAGGIGGFGGSSSDGYGGGSSSSSTSSGSAGGVGGFGGGSSDGYGGGSSSSSNSNTSSGSAGGVGGFGGGLSDGYGGGSSSGTQSSGGFSSGAASGSDSGGVGGSVGSGGVMGGGGLSGSSVGSGDVGSMGGSYGAPTAGGFSSSGDMSGGFGSFGSGPAANDTSGGFTGATPSASMMSGQTAAQSMSSEAASGGEAGEDGTGSMGGVSTAGAFGSFGSAGPAGLGSIGPYGSIANAQSAFGGASSSDGTVGTTPSSVGMSNPDAVAGLSPSGQMMGIMGMGGIDSGIAAMSNVGTTGALNGVGAYGLSTMNRDGSMPGFDNFGARGNVTQSSLGADGYGGTDLGSVNPAGSYTTPSGVQTGALTGALQGGLPSAEGYVGSYAGLGPNVPASVAAALGAPAPDAPAQTTQPAEAYHGVDLAVIGGMFGDVGDIFGGFTSPSTPSPYGTLSKTPMGPLNVGSLGQAMNTDRTSDTAGVNADGDPTAVNGTSALTIHGNLSPFSGATAGDLSPGAQSMTTGTPSPNIYGGQPAMAGPDATEAAHQYLGTQIGRATGVGTFGNDYDGQGFAQVTGYTDFAGNNLSGLGTPSAITDSQVAQARQNLANGTGTDQDRETVRNYLAQQNTSQGLALGTPSFAGDTTTTAPALTVRGLPQGPDFAALNRIEGGVLNGQVDPGNPTHYGPAQFSQATFSDTARAHPELGIGTGMSMFNATPDQYAAATQAHWSDIGAALQNAGLPDTPGNRYAGWNLGITGGILALSAGPDASLAQAGISADVQASNPSIYGGVQTVGQLQAKLAGMFSGTTNSAGPSASQAPTGLGLGTPAPGTFSPSGISFGQPGEDSTGDEPATAPAPATAPVTRTVTAPAPYGVSPEVASALTVNGLAPTPANALAADTLGVANGIAVMNGPPGDPISSVDISPATVQANPGLFSGVRTIGDLQANIAAAAPTAGTTISTVTDPNAPAQPSTLTISPGPRTTTPFSGYSGADGTSPSFGLNTMSAGVPATINNAGTYGVPSGVGVGQDEQNLAGFSQVPSSLPTFARGVVASPGFSPETGFSTAPDTSAPGPGLGITFNGTAAPTDGTSDPTTPDGAPAKHLSVPNWAGNAAAGMLAGAALGPVGSLLGFGNTISGWFGGPTAADGINAVLSHPGSPTSVTGSPTSASNSTTSNSDALQQQNAVAPSDGQGGYGSGSSSSSTASSGVSPYDPHAAAMAAYNAALAGMGKGTGSGTPDASPGPRPLLIRGRPVRQAPPKPLYRPMEDPIVRRALGLE